MARRMPTAKPASAALPPQEKSVGPSRKPKMGAVKSPAKSNLSARVKRTSDQPKPASV